MSERHIKRLHRNVTLAVRFHSGSQEALTGRFTPRQVRRAIALAKRRAERREARRR